MMTDPELVAKLRDIALDEVMRLDDPAHCPQGRPRTPENVALRMVANWLEYEGERPMRSIREVIDGKRRLPAAKRRLAYMALAQSRRDEVNGTSGRT